MIEEIKYCIEIIKKKFAKELVISKKDVNNLKNAGKYWICSGLYVDGDVRVIDHCCINEKYKRSAHRDFNIDLKLGVKLPVIFYNLKVYDSHHIMQGIGKICKLYVRKPSNYY